MMEKYSPQEINLTKYLFLPARVGLAKPRLPVPLQLA